MQRRTNISWNILRKYYRYYCHSQVVSTKICTSHP